MAIAFLTHPVTHGVIAGGCLFMGLVQANSGYRKHLVPTWLLFVGAASNLLAAVL